MERGHDKPRERRPYEPPRIVSSDAFERLALSCNGYSELGDWVSKPHGQGVGGCRFGANQS